MVTCVPVHVVSTFYSSLQVVREIALPCVADGNLVGVAYWFILHLDHHHSVSTGPPSNLGDSPQVSRSCWFPWQPYCSVSRTPPTGVSVFS